MKRLIILLTVILFAILFSINVSANTTAPTISSTAISNTTPDANYVIQINITTTDDTSISSIWIADNDTVTGAFNNLSSVNFTDTVTSIVWSYNDTATTGVIQYRFTVNDTSGNSVQSNLLKTEYAGAIELVTSTFTTDDSWNSDPAGDHCAVRFCWDSNSYPKWASFYYNSGYDQNTDWEVLLNTSDVVYASGVMVDDIINVTLNITSDSHPNGVCIWLATNLVTAAPGNEKISKNTGDLPKTVNGMTMHGYSEDADYSDFNNAFMFGEESFGSLRGIYKTEWANDSVTATQSDNLLYTGTQDKPPQFTLINLTSEGGLGQIIYPPHSELMTGSARTNDTTPTFRFNTSDVSDVDCTIIDNRTDTSTVCSTTGGGVDAHTCTQAVELPIGLSNQTANCSDARGYVNATQFLINITDPTPPNATLWTPVDNSFFTIGVNDTSINFTFSALDNYDSVFTFELYIDNVLKITNTSYNNGTNVSYLFDYGIGAHTWYVNSTDSYNNKNQSFINTFQVQQEETIDIFLDGLNESRKYEYLSLVNISANCTESLGGTCSIELSIDADCCDDFFMSGNNWINYTFNTTPLRIRNWSHGPRDTIRTESGTLNVTSNNLTIMELVSFNVSSSGGDVQNLNISYSNQSLTFRGDLKTIYLTDDEFIYLGNYIDAVNVTYTTAGSTFIYSDLTDISVANNLTFQLTGFDLDEFNSFNYIEHFNGTDGSSGFNDTLTYHSDAPLGIFDDLVTNISGRWNTDDSGCTPTLSYTSDSHGDYLLLTDSGGSGDGCWMHLDYVADEGNLINSSHIEIDVARTGGCSRGLNVDCTSSDVYHYFYASDGTSTILLDGDHTQCAANPSGATVDEMMNYTLIKVADDYKTWNVLLNGSDLGSKDLSSLDFTKPITFRLSPQWNAGVGGGCTASAGLRLYEVKFSGAWLNRSTNNGTYKPIGNITSNVLNVTQTNISKATLTSTTQEPTGTNIDFYLSNTCNNTLPIFESVTSGLTHTFITEGNEICWRATLNSSINITSPIIRKVEVDITSSIIENITVDIGDDGTDDFTHIGNLSGTTAFVNLSPAGGQLNTIKISSKTGGILQIDQFELNSSINPITLNETFLEDCSNCVVNFTFSGNSLRVFDLKWDFLGSWNYTAIASYGSLIVNKTIQIYYSNFNLSIPSGYDWWDVFPSSKDSKNVTPYTQNSNRPIWNLSNMAYDEPIDIYVKTNERNSCYNITFMNSSNQSNYATDIRFNLNTTYQKIASNISVNLLAYPNKGIWNWVDLSNCTNRFEIPWFYYSTICNDCVFDSTQLDRYNIIET